MSDVIHRTNRINGALEQKFSVNRPSYSTATWIHNPDLSAVAAVLKIYWKAVGDLIVEMTSLEKSAVDAARLAQHNTKTEAVIAARMDPALPLAGYATSVVVVGLLITVTIDSVVVSNQTLVAADVVLTKTVKVCYIRHLATATFSIEVFEKTDGLYVALAADEQVAADFGEWSVVANGTELVAV